MSFNQAAPSFPTIINSSNVLVFGNTTSTALTIRQFGAGPVMNVSNAAGTSALYVDPTAKVGIKTSNPSYLLQVGDGGTGYGSVPIASIFNGNMCAGQFGSLAFTLNDTTDVNVTKYLTFAITGTSGYQCSIDFVIEAFGYGDIIDRVVFRFTVDASCRSDGTGASASISPITAIGGGAPAGLTVIGATVSASTTQVRVSFLRTTALYAPWSYNALYTFRGVNSVACTGVSFA